jgi:FdrA protein
MTIPIRHIEVRPGEYHDSVTLLRASQAAAGVAGVSAAQIAMATPLNRELAAGLGFQVPDAGPNDLLLTVAADDQDAVDRALDEMRVALRPRSSESAVGLDGPVARSVRTACAASPQFPVVAISTPGHAALPPALDAIAAGRHVFLFSDNVPVAHEIALKDAAAKAGVLVMGPDCGTAIVGGVGLGFANVLRADLPGPGVGVVAASGTGAQQLTCLLDDAGVRVTQVLGVGGRDLTGPVGGRATLAALALLDRDPTTEHVVLISKPPDPRTADVITAAIAALSTPVSTVLLGPGRPDITASVEGVLARLGRPVPEWMHRADSVPQAGTSGALRGLFGGGTLADEAMLVAEPVLGPIRSNIPLRPESALPPDAAGRGLPNLTGLGSVVLDLGDDAFTVG